LSVFLLLYPTAFLMAQDQAPVLSSDQLDDLVAPIALYPDQLLAQVLAASTYPIEVVEAQQWLQQNRALQGTQLMDAARQQNWDPSVQAMIAFPNVLALLNCDIRWTTDLGNAFLAQQADVMNAVQRLRARARDNGRLASTPQQTVTQDQSAIEIQPANPQIIYVPSYNPAYVWGPPAYGAYPSLGYPDTGYGFGFNPGVLIGALFSGLLSFGGWGWGLNWLTHVLSLNNLFFGHFGFGGLGGGFGSGLAARSVWAHNPAHRLGVAYPNHFAAAHFAAAHSYSARSFAAAPRASSYSHTVDASRYNSAARSYRSPTAASYRSPASAYHSAPSHYSAPKAQSHYSAPKAPKMKAPKGGHSSHSSGGHGGGKHK
jgi:hypothetical protein